MDGRKTKNSNELTGARTSGGACGLIDATRRTLPGLDILGNFPEMDCAFGNLDTGAGYAQLCRRCVGLSPATERNPFPYLPAFRMGTLRILPVTNWRKAGDDVKSSWPYGQGYTRATMVGQRVATQRCDANLKKPIVVRIGVCNSTP